jgi:hypothetical protein
MLIVEEGYPVRRRHESDVPEIGVEVGVVDHLLLKRAGPGHVGLSGLYKVGFQASKRNVVSHLRNG